MATLSLTPTTKDALNNDPCGKIGMSRKLTLGFLLVSLPKDPDRWTESAKRKRLWLKPYGEKHPRTGADVCVHDNLYVQVKPPPSTAAAQVLLPLLGIGSSIWVEITPSGCYGVLA